MFLLDKIFGKWKIIGAARESDGAIKIERNDKTGKIRAFMITLNPLGKFPLDVGDAIKYVKKYGYLNE